MKGSTSSSSSVAPGQQQQQQGYQSAGFSPHDNDHVELDITEEVLYEVPFSFDQWKAEVLSYVALSLVCVVGLIGIPMLLCTPLMFLRFRYMFRRRSAYVTRSAIVLKTQTPAFLVFLPNRIEKTVQLSKIVDITIEQTWVQRLFRVSTLKIQNPGQTVSPSGIPTSDMELVGIEERQAQVVKRQLLALANRARQGMDPADHQGVVELAPLSMPDVDTGVGIAMERLAGEVSDIRQSLLRIEGLLAASSRVGQQQGLSDV